MFHIYALNVGLDVIAAMLWYVDMFVSIASIVELMKGLIAGAQRSGDATG